MSLRAMTWVWDNAPVAGTELLLLLAIADAADDEGRHAHPSVGSLAAKTRMDRRTVQRLVRRLADEGLLVITAGARGGGTNEYALVQNTTTTTDSGSIRPLRHRADLAAAVDHVLDQLTSWRIGPNLRPRLRRPVLVALEAGWTPEDLAAELGASPEGVRSPYRVLRTRLDELPEPPASTPARPAWCGACDETTRIREAHDGRALRCPACHPTASAESTSRTEHT